MRILKSILLLSVAMTPVASAAQSAPVGVASVVDAKAEKTRVQAEAKKQRELQRQYGLGPYPEEIDAYVTKRSEGLRPYYKTLYTGGERNSVLNFQRLGLAAMEAGEYKQAEWAFDEALTRIEAVYGKNKAAEAARSIFHNEANKEFKGEPYERAMAYYYRGLLYMRAADYDNARASFKMAEYQDTVSEQADFQSDFAVMDYLIGWTQRCQGQATSAEEAFGIAAKSQKGLDAPKVTDNMLVIAELGHGPQKVRSGQSQEALSYEAGPAVDETGALFTVKPAKGQPISIPVVMASSVYYQATTRGTSAMGKINDGKADTKQAINAVGSALMNSSLGGNSGMAGLGLGLAMKLFSSSMKAKADIRNWDGLPDNIMVGTTKASAHTLPYEVSFMAGDKPVAIEGAPSMRGGDAKCGFIWARSRAFKPADFATPGEDAGVAANVNRKPDVQLKNKQFRQTLETL